MVGTRQFIIGGGILCKGKSSTLFSLSLSVLKHIKRKFNLNLTKMVWPTVLDKQESEFSVCKFAESSSIFRN